MPITSSIKRTACVLALLLPMAIHAETVVIDAEDGAGPWGNLAGEGAGNDIVKAAFKAEGIDAQLHIVPYAKCKMEVMNGLVAACYSMAYAPMLDGAVEFADAPLYTPWAGIYATTNAKQASSVEELLKGHRIGIVNGYEYPETISNLGSKGFDVITLSSEDVLMQNLDSGKIDFAIFMLDDLKNVDYLLRNSQVKHPPVLRMKVPSTGSYVGFSLKHHDGKRLKKTFDNG